VWMLDVNEASTLLLTASADMSARVWEVETGVELVNIPHCGPVRACAFAEGGRTIATATDPFQGNPSSVHIFDFPEDVHAANGLTARTSFPVGDGIEKVNHLLFTALNKEITGACDDGLVRFWAPCDGVDETGIEIRAGDEMRAILPEKGGHSKNVKCIDFNTDKTLLLTASEDCTAKLFAVDTLEPLKTYETERPVNGASLSPLKDHIILGGGQDAMSVTTTAGRQGKFEAKIYHTVYEEVLGQIKGHFGPINTISFAPDGCGYSSGGEDGYIRMHKFDHSYFTLGDELDDTSLLDLSGN